MNFTTSALIDAGGEGVPHAYWLCHFHFQLENEFSLADFPRGGIGRKNKKKERNKKNNKKN